MNVEVINEIRVSKNEYIKIYLYIITTVGVHPKTTVRQEGFVKASSSRSVSFFAGPVASIMSGAPLAFLVMV